MVLAAKKLTESRRRVLVVDDDAGLRSAMRRSIALFGYEVETADDGAAAVARIAAGGFNCIVSDISMPNMTGIQMLRAIREHDLDVPVILVTGEPAVDTAVQALQYGALHYLAKPVDLEELERVMERGVRLHRMALIKREAMELLGGPAPSGDRAGLEASFGRALDRLWMAYQPIVRAADQSIFGYEALLRSDEPSLPHPGAIIEAAERLDRLVDLGRAIRENAARPMVEAKNPGVLFVNLHPRDLLDPSLMDPGSPLARIAKQVVLEITERSAIDDIDDVRGKVAALRELGYRIAVDDLGAGYAGLTSFATLEPEIVKLDMTLVRDVHITPTKQKLVRSMTALCHDMGMMIVAEGVETKDERDALIEAGCDLLQGYHFAKPARPFPVVRWA